MSLWLLKLSRRCSEDMPSNVSANLPMIIICQNYSLALAYFATIIPSRSHQSVLRETLYTVLTSLLSPYLPDVPSLARIDVHPHRTKKPARRG